jgi:outer membrane protein TolC
LSIPLGGARQAALSRTSAEFAIAQAVSERDTQRRNLELNFHDAHHELEVTREQIELAGASLEFISRQADMAQIAYEQGESSLIELLRERRRLRSAEAQLQQLTLTENLLIALYNQAVGVLP